MRAVRLVTSPGAEEPVRLQEVRDLGRIVLPDEDRAIEQLLLAARREVERYSRHVLVPGTYRVLHDAWCAQLELVVMPVETVDSVTYQYADGTSEVVDDATYVLDQSHTPPRLVFLSDAVPPTQTLRVSGGVEVEITAGYATRADVPEDIRQHVMTLALLMYEHRDDPEALERVRHYAADGAWAFGAASV